ncbi:MAG: RDD family protein [SAR202 cluster bacterium]|nr:RDD family protein [SAR202 cluster bacterium]
MREPSTAAAPAPRNALPREDLFAHRLLAYLIDFAVAPYCIVTALAALLALPYSFSGTVVATAYFGPLVLVPLFSFSVSAATLALHSVALIGYFAYQGAMFHYSGQTVGKRILGIRVVDGGTSRQAGLTRGFVVRELVRRMMWLLPFMSIVDTAVIWLRSDKRTLHDVIVDTDVVRAAPGSRNPFNPTSRPPPEKTLS